MAVSNHWSSVDLKSVDFNGLIREDVMDKIFDISRIPLPLTDLIGSDSADNSYTEWTEDKLAQPNTANAVAEDAVPTQNDAKGGARIGNQCQISIKQVGVTHRADASDTIGRRNEMAYQIMMRQRELRRDVEAISLTGQGSQAPTTQATAPATAGLGAMITQGNRIGTGGGFSSGVWAAFVPGAKRALTETMVRDVAQEVWEKGGNPSVIMSVPKVIRNLSSYMFTSSARIATLQGETNNEGPATAMGSVNVFLTDFGVELRMSPNRLQQPYDSAGGTTGDAATAFILDPAYARHGFLQGYRTDEQAKTGMTNTRLMSVDWTTKVLNREAHGVITDIDIAAAVTT
ncbi:DUF5309 family protein [Tropicibacter sp. Alg240-R139]|uniref:SU10 major capsid protein n=1 Tax=Tropicibacter sp. Alg240-R139 TaxID=2305991 RepID=UPI0013E0C7B2|nr:DUF5309 family protein [Tropicibacter sp. Alg240-R139]